MDEALGVDGNWHPSNKATIWRWRSAYQNDFAARMIWTVTTNWFYYPEPGTFTISNARSGAPVKIDDADQVAAWFTVPTERVLRNGTMHIILAVTDTGQPQPTRYHA